MPLVLVLVVVVVLIVVVVANPSRPCRLVARRT
jgi:hypothetical protein